MVFISSSWEYATPWPHRFKIWVRLTLLVRDLTAYGSKICFGGFCLPPLTANNRSCPNHSIRRCVLGEQDSIPEKLVLPVNREYKNCLTTSGMFTALSVKSDGFGGHGASVS